MYVSIDIDVLDPAHAPGTGTPEAGGLTSRELLNTLRGLVGLDVVGADIVEVARPTTTLRSPGSPRLMSATNCSPCWRPTDDGNRSRRRGSRRAGRRRLVDHGLRTP